MPGSSKAGPTSKRAPKAAAKKALAKAKGRGGQAAGKLAKAKKEVTQECPPVSPMTGER